MQPWSQPLLWKGIAVAATTWNPADKSAKITLSNGNLTATSTNTSDGAVRSTTSHGSGKYYVEFATGAVFGGTDTGIGIALSSASLTGIGVNAAGACIVISAGQIWYNGSYSGMGITSFNTNTIVCMAVDLGNKRIWFRLTNGNWNNNVSADPASNVGGLDISALFPGTGAFLTFASNTTNSVVTINCGQLAFSYPVPSGFNQWG